MCVCMCPHMDMKPTLHNKDHEVCEIKRLKGKKKNKIETEQEQCGWVETIAMAARQRAHCVTSQPFCRWSRLGSFSCSSLPLSSVHPGHPGPCTCGTGAAGSALRTYCHRVLGSRKDWPLEDASQSLWPWAVLGCRVCTGSWHWCYCGTGQVWFMQTRRSGGWRNSRMEDVSRNCQSFDTSLVFFFSSTAKSPVQCG